MGGKPCVRGMRVTVGMIVGLVASGHGFSEILAASIPALRMRTSVRHWNMPRGGWKRSKCRCRLHEIPDRQPSAADSEILDFAAANGWIVFTHDLDFGMLPGAMKTNSPSVVQMRCQDVLPAAVGDMVVRAILIAEPHLKAGALVTVDSRRHRIRLLPI